MNRMTRILDVILTCLLAGCLASACTRQGALQAGADYWPTQAWQSTTPEEQGMDSGKLAQLFEAIEQQDIHLHSLLIVRNGYLVTEVRRIAFPSTRAKPCK